MSNVAAMAARAAEADSAGDAAVAAGAAAQGDGEATVETARSDGAAAAPRRSLLVPVLSTLVAALIAAMFGFAVVGFNTLRDDIRGIDSKFEARFDKLDAKIDSEIGSLRSDMDARFAAQDAKIDSEIGSLRSDMDARFAAQDERFDRIESILLDHTERLARIEALHETHAHMLDP